MNLEMMSGRREYCFEAYVKVSSRLGILIMSSMSLSGVLEDMEVPDEPENGVR